MAGPNKFISRNRAAFTLLELLIVIAIISILAAILFPVISSARERAREATCESNLKQIGLAMTQYQQDNDELFPDRPDLKATPNPPWGTTTYPTSDPRCGWAPQVLDPYVKSSNIWWCPSVAETSLATDQHVLETVNGVSTLYWMWPFDHNSPFPVDDFWGKTDQQSIDGQHAAYEAALAAHTSYPKGDATSVSDCQLVCDPYFPNTPNVQPPSIRGAAVHFGGRENLYLDGHVKWIRDARLND